MGSDFVLQQDNVAIHNSKLTKPWFADKNIELHEWPICYPDFNPLVLFAHRVYENDKQFDNVNMLKCRECWAGSGRIHWKKMFLSIKSRVIEIIGKITLKVIASSSSTCISSCIF